MPILVLAFLVGCAATLADSIGWPMAILVSVGGIGFFLWGGWLLVTWAEGSDDPDPIGSAAYAALTGDRCNHCEATATHKSKDGLFRWCAMCKGPDDVPIYGVDLSRYSAVRYIPR